jgi:hypothetical protein
MGTEYRGVATGAALGTILAFTPLGQWGWLVGMTIGQYLFPPKLEKPDRYTELGLNTAQTDIPIPLLYGTMKFGGNYVWKGRLRSKAIKSSKGGSGGGRQVTGYKYYMNAAIGLCQYETYITRMWKNNDPFFFEENPAVTVYAGTSDQTIDPTIGSSVTNAVPFRGLCYVVFDDLYIGKNNATAPTFNFEGHRYPYNANAGDSARIYQLIESKDENESIGVRDFCVKDYAGRTILVNESEIRIYKRKFEDLEKTIDISILNLTVANHGIYDIDLIETGKKLNLHILHYDVSSPYYLHVSTINLKKHFSDDTLGIGDVIQTVVFDNPEAHFSSGSICHNKDNSYICYCHDTTGYKIKKFTWNDFTEELAKYNVAALVDNSGNIFSMDVTEDYAFCASGVTLVSFSISGLSKVDELDLTAYDIETKSIAILHGGDELVMFRVDGDESYLNVIGYNVLTGGDLTLRRVIDVSELWDTTPTAHSAPNIKWCYDGTLFVCYGANGFRVQYLIMDANPAQIFYDIFVNERRIPEVKLDLYSLQDLSDYCIDNQIGVTIFLNTAEKTCDFLQNLLGYIHGTIHINNEGKYTFKTFQNTDPSIATIGDADIEAGEYQKVEVNLKDKNICSNRINIKFIDRSELYQESSFQIDHFLAQEEDGEIITEDVDYLWISNPKTAARQAYRLLKFAQYDTKLLTFSLMPKYLYLNVGDVITVNTPDENIDNQKVRIISIDEPDIAQGGSLRVVARLEADYLNTFENYKISTTKSINTAASMPSSMRPFVFEQPPRMNNDVNTLCLSAIRTEDDMIGCDVYVAEEDLSYKYIGSISYAITGDINKAIDEFDKEIELNTAPYPDTFSGVTVLEQRRERTFSLIGELVNGELGLDNLEFVSYRGIESSSDIVTLSNCYRGKDYTIPKVHTTDEVFVTVEPERYLSYAYPDTKLGSKIYIKCVAINYRGDEQDFDDADVYEYTLQGYTRKATHVSALQLYDNDGDLRGLRTTSKPSSPEHVYIKWKNSNRVGGIGRSGFDWVVEHGVYLEPDTTFLDVMIYDTGMNLIATHQIAKDAIDYEYTNGQNAADFGIMTYEFYIGVRPRNELGYVPDVVVQYVNIN